MDILLIKPYWPYPYSAGEYTYNRIWPPLSLLNCAGMLEKNGFEVKILDAHAQRIKPEKIHNYIRGFDKVFITSSSLDRWQCPNIDITFFLDAVKEIRKNTSEVYILGYHGTLRPEHILKDTKAKAVIRAEPEDKVLKICQGRNLSDIPGLTFEQGQEIISTENSPPLDLNSLSTPAYHLLDLNRYFYEILGDRFALFEGSRGCNFNCNFCNRLMYPGPIRKKDSKKLTAELRYSIERCKVRSGYFIDLDFLSNIDTAMGVCEFLAEKKYKFKWCCQTRADSLNPDILTLMKKAGCKVIHLGIESGSQRLLDSLSKDISLESFREGVGLIRKTGIKVFCFFILGLPRETAVEREETINFAKELKADFVSFHALSDYSRDCKSGIKEHCSLEVRSDIKKAYQSYYLRPSYIAFLPGKIGVNMAFKIFKLYLGRIKTFK